MADYVSTVVTSAKWGVKARQVALLCEKGRVPGAYKVGTNWIIPADAEKPADARIKSGKYIGAGQSENRIKAKRKRETALLANEHKDGDKE